MLPETGLAYAIARAAALIEAVIGGANLTEAWEGMLREHPHWPDATRGAVRDLAWGTLRDYGRAEAVLSRLMQKPLDEPYQSFLRIALHRLERCPEQAHTIVDQAVEAVAAAAPGLKGVVNGVLRNVVRQGEQVARWREADAVARHRHPQWWIDRLRAAWPAEWEDALAAGSQHPPMALRVNQRRATVEEVIAELDAAGIAVRRLSNDALLLTDPLPVARLPGFAEGRVSVQDAGAQWAARWLEACAGERVLDACAAPGGKAAHILEGADAALTALEIDPRRARRIEGNFARLGLHGTVRVGDARHPERWWDGRPFDRILADVPCSASGVARRHPDIKWLRRREDIAHFAAQQAGILDALWQTLAPGGTMLYVTCSVFDEENRGQMARFRERHADVLRLPIDGRLEQQLLPTPEHDGFYYALLRKRV
ncbi:16S rRNA (cytosine(967)-C(5))-methyltransferase RsmB [Pseudothauera nasutitermitis]|uniref:16S rRNA (cytosine(967)-C(5))-methyltransferase RsmB n=1 Tax=Pseudothauera nasutitermitis TaxID=2565930 RepID=UPI001E2FA746|nr:16S rRNA (cytosine(967)-C(5))-methyltransferase RsmB [Pseudothauera nasutitermitis]